MSSYGYGSRNDDDNLSNSRISDGFPANGDKCDEGRRDDDAKMPDLIKIDVPKPPIDPNTPKAKIVVVANLPTEFKQTNVYKLCTANAEAVAVQPLHIAMKKINRPPEPEISYAYVYYKSDEEVNIVVENLNNLTVNGFTLVVYSVEKLLEE